MWLLAWWIYTVTLTVQVTSGASLICYKCRLAEYDEVPLIEAFTLLKSSCYNSSKENIFYTFGFGGKVKGTATKAVIAALCQRDNTNVLLLNWEKEASSINTFGRFGKMLSYVVKGLPQVATVSAEFAEALSTMSDRGLMLNRTRLIGHSLGAHLCGNTGRGVMKMGKKIDRITGLDSASAFYDSPPILPPLATDCADFVDTIHTDPGGLGMNTSRSHVDVYVNFGQFISGPEEEQVQPGCPVGDFELLSVEDRCSHDRSWMLEIESWFYPDSLQASKAADYNQWLAMGGSADIVVMGDNMDRKARGNFYMTTNAESLYGRGMNGTRP